MNRIIRKIILSSILCSLAIFGLGGCTQREIEITPIDGGTTDKTDYNAPKEIKSKEISSFEASFCLFGEWSMGRESTFYFFSVKPDEDGVLTASESAVGVSAPADEELLTALQKKIDDHHLVENNGVYRVTAGLAPEYQESSLTVNYMSGELLTFTVNNDPEALWAKELYLTFADWFAQRGEPSLLPPEMKGQVKSLSLDFIKDGLLTSYGEILALERDAILGERRLLQKNIYDTEAMSEVSKEMVLFPTDYDDRITEILSRYDLRPFDSSSALYGMGRTVSDEDEADNEKLKLHITYEDGSRLNIDTDDEKDIETLMPLVTQLANYHDSLFSEAKE